MTTTRPTSGPDPGGDLLAPSDVGSAARAGVRWLLAGRVLSQAVQVVTSVVLARILVPDDFGLIAMAVAVGGLPKAVGDFGLSTLVVQRREIDRDFINGAFSLNLLIFIGLGILQVFLAPVGGLVLSDRRVVGVIAALAFALPFEGFASFIQALLRRRLDFSEITKLNLLAAAVTSLVACLLAANGMGVWSLVIAQIAAPASVSVRAWTMVGGDLKPAFSVSQIHYREIFDFGRFATGNSFINYVVQNMDYLLIGRLLPVAQLGFYYFAFEKSRILSRRLLDLYSNIALPAFSRMGGNTERIRLGYRAATTATLLIISPVVTFLAFQARLVIPLVFGQQWSPSVLVFQILSVHVIVNAVTSGTGSVLYAVGRPDISFKIVRWIVIPLVISYYLGASTGGIVGVAIAVSVVKSLFSLIKLAVCFRFLGWETGSTLRPVTGVVLGATVAGVFSLGLGRTVPVSGDWLILLMSSLFFCLIFGASQLVANRTGLGLVWGTVLSPGQLGWCRSHLSGSFCRVLCIPAE